MSWTKQKGERGVGKKMMRIEVEVEVEVVCL